MFDGQGIEGLIGRTFDGFRVTRFIARGGMGVVYEGVQESLGRPVAVKFLYPHLSADDNFRERFEREARAAGSLNHPNIVRVLDFGSEGMLHYMVMEYVEGESLRDRLSRIQSEGLVLRTSAILSIIQQIGGALSYAHQSGYVHRDVKPGNILLMEGGRALLTDFGVVKVVGASGLTVTGAMVGTPEYMAPEQSLGTQPVGTAADQYSLAVIAYQMMTGRVPFQAPTPAAVIRMHASDPPPPPSSFNPMFPAEIEAVLNRALAKNPYDRFESVEAFVEQLTEAVGATHDTSGVTIADTMHTVAPVHASAVPADVEAATETESTPPEEERVSSVFSRWQWPAVAGIVGLFVVLAAIGGVILIGGGSDNDSREDARAAEIVSATETAEAETEAETPADPTPAPTPTDPPATPTEEPSEEPSPTAETTPTPSVAIDVPPIENTREVIMFSSHRVDVHDSQIYMMNPDGTDVHQVTIASGHSWAPRISPNGEQFVFSSTAPGEHEAHGATGGGVEGEGQHDIYIANVDGTGVTNLTHRFPGWNNAWSWSPDGEWITFTSNRDGNWEIYKMTPDGQNVTRLTDEETDDGWPVWTPDGEHIVFVSERDGTSEIYIMDADGSNPERLFYRPETFDTYPDISPDGTKVVFSSQIARGFEGDIYVIDIDGSNLDRITNTAALNYAPKWSPDGSQIVYVSNRDGVENIWVMDADGSNQRQLTDNPGEDTTPDWGFVVVPSD